MYIIIIIIIIMINYCLTTGPKPPPKRFLHTVRSRASSFKWQYPLLSLRSSSSFLCLLPRLLATSISPFMFPSITCFRRQFLRKMWQIQLAFCFLILCRIFLCSLTLSNTYAKLIRVWRFGTVVIQSNICLFCLSLSKHCCNYFYSHFDCSSEHWFLKMATGNCVK